MAKISFEEAIKQGVEQAMKECELTIGMTLKEAVEKQIPKKPAIYKDTRDWFDLNGNVTGTYETDVIECPVCGEYLLDLAAFTEYQEILNYCNRCGQALDFSEVQEE